MDLDWISFGNAYYITNKSLCGGDSTGYSWNEFPSYDASVRKCFNEKCGNSKATADCFPVDEGPVCQHGAAECAVNLLQMCSQHLEKSWKKSAPFNICIESKYETISSSVTTGTEPNMTAINLTVEECVKQTHFGHAAEEVVKCFTDNNKPATNIMILAAAATPPHPGTPFVQVTNKTGAFVLDLSNTTLLKAVCAAYEYNGGALKAVKGCESEDNTLII